ncbi:histidine kinase [Geodermatophilus sp. CPCC 206100]|uniref:histidine kinase n=1 Tax=Geodermatophilus sp. CPCC 206100 TaxID=3020054 RepID=UPI003B00BF65
MTSTPAASAGDAPGAAGQPEADPPDPVPVSLRPLPSRAERERWQRRLRLQRQLHDGASLRISALVPQLGVVRNEVPEALPALHASIEGLQDQLHAALQELREIARAIYPPLLDEAGLGPALREFADRAEVPVRIDVGPGRFGSATEGAAYFAVTDCLAAVRAGGAPIEVVGRREGDVLVLVLTGVPLGLAGGVLDHVCGLGGEVTPSGAEERGTIEVRIPCA